MMMDVMEEMEMMMMDSRGVGDDHDGRYGE